MRLKQRISESFVAGLILIGPLLLTLFILRILVNWVLQFIDPFVAGTGLLKLTGGIQIAAQIAAAVLIVLVITVLGFLTQWSVGKHLFGNFGRIINIIPLVSTLYGSIRQVATSLVERDSQFESVVLVEHPRMDIYTIGLVTNDGIDEIEEVTGEPTAAVFMPHSPNPTAGKLAMVPKDQIHETSMSVRQGMRLILTTGIGDKEEQLDQYVDDDDASVVLDGV